ncbi:hypothetical protein GT755_07140 [Herbidospora sp. NEAU-GS84]|uniref:Uncharacterized protein n=1 Tax=Herbidospora solisilvae TaxID=2696284 RepID=A0A7C9J224_9ACTN|nr:hypothetical protein [Herbidospora solisilvae]NAS21460.1 hypothetical protein [Herbidospora solisilvae]
MTDDLFLRMVSHRQNSAWWYGAHRIAWDQYPTRQAAEIAEYRAIRDLVPLHNVRDNGRRAFAARMDIADHTTGHVEATWADAPRSARRTQKSVAANAHVEPAEYRALEQGESTSFRRELRLGVEYALRRREGSVEAVLSGGEPAPITDEEWGGRLRQAHDAIAIEDRI